MGIEYLYMYILGVIASWIYIRVENNDLWCAPVAILSFLFSLLSWVIFICLPISTIVNRLEERRDAER